MQYKLNDPASMTVKILIFCVLLPFLFYGCSGSSSREYRDFISEMDILTRLDLCLRDAQLNKADLYTKTELHYIKADLAEAPGELYQNVTRLFSQTVDLLLEHMERLGDGNIEAAAAALSSAGSKYIKAKSALFGITPEVKNV